ncbi:MAG: amidohydrolase family protein [Pyrinomonadaceae bacterium]
MKNLSTLVLMLFLLGSVLLGVQAQTTKVITGATLIDGTGRAPIPDAVIVIEGTRISQVGRRETTAIPRGAQMIDARGMYVVPGLADMHNHLGDGTFSLNQGEPNLRKNFMEMLGWGFTYIFAPGHIDLKSSAELKRLAADDAAPYPHFLGVGLRFGAKGGHGSTLSAFTPETPDEARQQVRELKAANVYAVKIIYDDLSYVTKQPRAMLKPEVVAAIIDEAHRQGLKAYVHAPVLKFAKEVLRDGADGLMHGIISDPVDDEFISLMKRNHAVYIPTHTIFESISDLGAWAKREESFNVRGLVEREVFEVGMSPATVREWEARWDNLSYLKKQLPIVRANTRKVWDAGILLVAGSDTGSSGSGVVLGLSSQLELTLLVEAGLTPRETLQAATLNAARMVGREQDLGTVQRGKLADLLILEADPIADIGNVRRIFRVIKGGAVHDPAELFRAAKQQASIARAAPSLK